MPLKHVVPGLMCVFGLIACGGSDGDSGSAGGNGSSSQNTSHRAGEACMDCHKLGGSAETAAIFASAGTVYQSNGSAQANARVNLFIHGTNTLSASMTTDDSGNFYTSTAVDGLFTGGDLVTGVDVNIEGPGGERNMPGTVTNGNCNSCHGQSVGRITAN